MAGGVRQVKPATVKDKLDIIWMLVARHSLPLRLEQTHLLRERGSLGSAHPTSNFPLHMFSTFIKVSPIDSPEDAEIQT